MHPTHSSDCAEHTAHTNRTSSPPHSLWVWFNCTQIPVVALYAVWLALFLTTSLALWHTHNSSSSMSSFCGKIRGLEARSAFTASLLAQATHHQQHQARLRIHNEVVATSRNARRSSRGHHVKARRRVDCARTVWHWVNGGATAKRLCATHTKRTVDGANRRKGVMYLNGCIGNLKAYLLGSLVKCMQIDSFNCASAWAYWLAVLVVYRTPTIVWTVKRIFK